jgi:hypothetical protein
MLWNRLYPEDQRTELWFCSETCIFKNGLKLGKAFKDGLTLPPVRRVVH